MRRAAVLCGLLLAALPVASAGAQTGADDQPEPRVRSADVLSLPSAARCVRGGQVPMRLRLPRELTLRKLRIRLRGVTVAEVERLRRSLRGTILLPARGRATVQLTARTEGGRTLRVSRRYRTCSTPPVRPDRVDQRGPVILEGGGED